MKPKVAIIRRKKSVVLESAELKALKNYRGTFHTDTDFAEDMLIDRVTLLRIIDNGSGSQANIDKIRNKLNTLLEKVN